MNKLYPTEQKNNYYVHELVWVSMLYFISKHRSGALLYTVHPFIHNIPFIISRGSNIYA